MQVNSTPTITVFQGNGRDEKLAYEHYLQVYHATKEACGCDFIAPPDEVFAKHVQVSGTGEAQAQVLEEVLSEMKVVMADQEWGVRLGTHKKRAVVEVMVETIVNSKISQLRASASPAVLFKPMLMSAEQRASISEGKIADYLAMEKVVKEDNTRYLKAAGIARASFGKAFRDMCQGASNTMYETMEARDIMKLFVDTKVVYLDDQTKLSIKDRIARLDGKTTEVQAVDAVVRLHKALDIAGVLSHSAEKKAILLQAVATHIGEQSRTVMANLPQRYLAEPGTDGEYAYEAIVEAVNKVRTTSYIFPARDEGQSKLAVVQQAMGRGYQGHRLPAGAQGGPTSGNKQPIRDFEPQLSDNIRKWDKGVLCAYHYRNGPYGTTPPGSHTNNECKRDKKAFFEKQYAELIEFLNRGSK